jgi:hypothetical protein
MSVLFFLYGGVNQYARLLGLFAMQDNTHFKNKIKTFNAYTLPKVHQLGGITIYHNGVRVMVFNATFYNISQWG